jgi:hypothetical protein
MSYKAILRSRALQTAMNTVAMVAMVTLLLASARVIGYALALVAFAAVIWIATTKSFATTMPAQLMITIGLLADYDRGAEIARPTLFATGLVLAASVVTQPNVQELVNRQVMRIAHLPGYRKDRQLVVLPRVLYVGTIVLIAALAVTVLAKASLWPLLIASIVEYAGIAFVAVQALRFQLGGRTEENAVRAALNAYKPKFAVYFTGPENTEYQLLMWLPYFERIGERFVVIVREKQASLTFAKATSMPVIHAPALHQVEDCVTDSMHACFFVNNGAKNSHMVRFSNLTHIQLLHGDSDKASSFNPVTAMFDRIFVAGQAGIDRYAANGVDIAADRFDIVGRPQVESIAVTDASIADTPDEGKTVLYATTWVGLYTDANYCSLAYGESIVSALLARGARVIFRPHPYSARNPASVRQVARIDQLLAEDAAKTGRQHLYGEAATGEMSVIDCVNASDALVGDVSAVATDWLYSAKPFALTNPFGLSSEEYESEFPLARAAYVLDEAVTTLDEVLDKLLHTDPMADERRLTRRYYLGDFPPEGYAYAFVDTARRYVLEDHVPRADVVGRTADRIEPDAQEDEDAVDEGAVTDPVSDSDENMARAPR